MRPRGYKATKRTKSSLKKKTNKNSTQIVKPSISIDEKLDYFYAPYRKDYVKEHEK